MSVVRVTTVPRVVARIRRDLGITTPGIEVEMIEWIAEALEHIGEGPTFSQITTRLEVVDGRATLPALTVQLVSVGVFPDYTALEDVPEDAKSTSLPALLRRHDGTRDGYAVAPPYLSFSFAEGVVEVVTMGFAIDANQIPYIPDNPSFLEAMTWYVASRMTLAGYTLANPKHDFDYCDARWKYYCNQARTRAIYPTEDEAMTLVRDMTRMVDLRRYPGETVPLTYGNSALNLVVNPFDLVDDA